MKSSILVCELEKGALHSVAFPLCSEALAAAQDVRKARTVEVGKKAVAVVTLAVITQNGGGSQVVKQFNVKAEAAREAVVVKAAKEAKAKAEESKK